MDNQKALMYIVGILVAGLLIGGFVSGQAVRKNPNPGGGGCKDRDSDSYYDRSGCGTSLDCNDNDVNINPMILEDINENPFKEFKLLQPLPVRPRMQEMRDINYEKNMEEEYAKPAEKPRIKIRDISEPLEAPIREKAKGPVYVKIEKFESALSDFEEIRKRLHESFELLEKVKSIRGREEEELEAWEREVDNIKRKLLEIDRNLFNRADY